MNPVCNIIAERVALGESLGEHAAHVTTCARCQRVVALPASLASAHRDIEPGMGFAARMTVGAQQRITVRRRRRVAGAVGAGVAASAVLLLVVMRTPETSPPPSTVASSQQPPVADDKPVALDEADLAMLVNYADTARSNRAAANWRHITQPLRPYKNLLKGIKP